MTDVREAAFALFRDFGMTTIFGNPGSTELPMFKGFPDDFRYVLALQESSAVGMADGFAQATRNAALVNLHSAVGVGHALGNLFTAFRNRTPLVVIAGQQARSTLPYFPFLYAEQATLFPKPYVKWSVEPARAEDVPAAIARAYHLAMQPPRGPVFVSVPVDDWDRPCEALPARRVSRRVRGDAALLAELAAALAAAKRPVFVAGAEAARDQAWDEMIALAERHQALVWASPMSSRNAFPEDHALFAGFLTAGREAIAADLAGHDLVLVLGAPVFTYHVEGFGPFLPDGASLWQIIDDPALAAAAPVGTAIVGDIRDALASLLEGEAPKRSPPEARALPAPPAAEPLTDAYVLSRLAALRAPDSIIVEEAPSARGPMHDHLPDPCPRHLLHLRERRPRLQPAGRDRDRARPARRQGDRIAWRRLGPLCDPGALVGGAAEAPDQLPHSQQLPLRGPDRLRAALRPRARHRHRPSGPRLRRPRLRPGRRRDTRRQSGAGWTRRWPNRWLRPSPI